MTFRSALPLLLATVLGMSTHGALAEQPAAFTRAVAVASAESDTVARFYQERRYRTLWTGPEDASRRAAFLTAISTAADQGLPAARYDAASLVVQFHAATTEDDRGRLEVAMTRAFMSYVRDLRSGVLTPSRIDSTIVRDVHLRAPLQELAAFEADPSGFLKTLAPQDPEYARLVRAKLALQRGPDWGAPVPAGTLRPRDTGPAVIALRDRLIAMGYLHRSSAAGYDEALQIAVAGFQADHGLNPDGITGEGTLRELNIGPDQRLKSVIVALERHRWMNMPREDRYIWVNLPEYTTRIVDHGRTVFSTRSVIGKEAMTHRTPEFSDQMDHMIINPSWHVPRSITTAEYLPMLQRNPNAVSHIQVIDGQGHVIDRRAINFGAYTARTFPFSMRQAPSDDNALGLVKFMFPNQWNIYLHDTPSKSLFSRDLRAFSHGCVRLADPFDFAYAMLAAQSDDPQAEFQRILATGKETRVTFRQPVPVHLVYFTAFSSAKGRMGYRADVYGRDAAIWDALEQAGVALHPVQG